MACTSVLTATNGFINYYGDLDTSTTCYYLISVPNPTGRYNSLKLSFAHVSYVNVYDGFNSLAPSFTENAVPGSLFSIRTTGLQAYVLVDTLAYNSSIDAPFRLFYSVDGCTGITRVNGSSGSIEDGSLQSYDSGLNCTFLIESTPEEIIEVRFIHLTILLILLDLLREAGHCIQ